MLQCVHNECFPVSFSNKDLGCNYGNGNITACWLVIWGLIYFFSTCLISSAKTKTKNWVVGYKVLCIDVNYFSAYSQSKVCENKPARSWIKGCSYKDTAAFWFSLLKRFRLNGNSFTDQVKMWTIVNEVSWDPFSPTSFTCSELKGQRLVLQMRIHLLKMCF